MTYEDVKRIRQNPTIADVDNKELSKMIDEAVEKQIPKKPDIDIGYDMEGNAWNNWHCSCCRKTYLLDDEEYNYCPDCGQAIDWEEGGGNDT